MNDAVRSQRRKCFFREFRVALAELRRVYKDSDGGHVVDAFDEARRSSFGFRLLTGALERIYPVRAFLHRAAYLFDPAIGEMGLGAGCRHIFDELGLQWTYAMSEQTQACVAQKPVILYGNHPSLLTPFLTAAVVDREDLRFCSTNYVRRLIPRFRKYCHPLEVQLTKTATEWRRGGLRRVLAYRLISLLHAVPDGQAIREINRETLRLAGEDLRSGGCVMIIPGGGGTREGRWFGGIGILARDVLEHPGEQDVWIVPVREENSSNHRIYASMMNGPVARMRHRRFERQPIVFRLAEPAMLKGVVSLSQTTRQMVDSLRNHFENSFPG